MADMIDAAGQAALRELIPVGADVDDQDADGRSALWHVSWRGELEAVVHLVAELGASPTLADSGGRSPLYAAAGYIGGGGHLEVVQWLAGNGGSVTQPTNDGHTPIHGAAQQGHLAVVQWLAGHGASVTQYGYYTYSPLSGAAYNGHLAIVQWLAGHGASVSQATNDGTLPTALATGHGHDTVAAFLTAAASWPREVAAARGV